MSRDGSGNYTRVAGPYVGGTTILKDNINDELDDVADALSDSINVAGTKPMAANLPMGGNKVTGLAASTSNGDAVRHEQITGVFEPLDAMLTSIAGMAAWAAGQNLIKVTGVDTAVLSNELAQATVPLTLTNNADSASVEGLIVQGDRASPANTDALHVLFKLSDTAGNQDTFARITVRAQTATSASEAGQLRFGIVSAGVLADELGLDPSTLFPTTSGGLSLGSTAFQWNNLHLSEGGAINWDNGDAVLTQTGNLVALSGATLRAGVYVSTETGGTLTAESENAIVDLATGPTINDGVFAVGSTIVLFNNTAGALTITQDTGMTLRLHGTATTGNLTLAARGMAAVQIDPITNAEAICSGDVS